jgi:hypothetical protein
LYPKKNPVILSSQQTKSALLLRYDVPAPQHQLGVSPAFWALPRGPIRALLISILQRIDKLNHVPISLHSKLNYN